MTSRHTDFRHEQWHDLLAGHASSGRTESSWVLAACMSSQQALTQMWQVSYHLCSPDGKRGLYPVFRLLFLRFSRSTPHSWRM